MKTGANIKTYKPVMYKPSEQAIVVSERNNDRKFMFLSEETKPDYRPRYSPGPRSLGSDSNKVSQGILIFLDRSYSIIIERLDGTEDLGGKSDKVPESSEKVDKWERELCLPRLGPGPDLQPRHPHGGLQRPGPHPEVQQQGGRQGPRHRAQESRVGPVQADQQSEVRGGEQGQEDPAPGDQAGSHVLQQHANLASRLGLLEISDKHYSFTNFLNSP